MLVDTHCHIHESNYSFDIEQTLARAREAGVEKMICVGTSEQSSREAIVIAEQYTPLFAAVGVHPHEAKEGYELIAELAPKQEVVAIGEIGLDYFYNHSPRETQIAAFEAQLQVARDNNLPVIFHVRDASSTEQQSVWNDFWPIFDKFPGLRGVLHSYTDNAKNLEIALSKGLFIGVNGISTFTKDTAQQELFASILLEKLLLETDAPFLTPVPFRGKINEPAFVRNVAEYHAKVRGLSLEELAKQTSQNVRELFAI